jgi:hypothetical protein
MNLLDLGQLFYGAYDKSQQNAMRREQLDMEKQRFAADKERQKAADGANLAGLEREREKRSILAQLYAPEGGPPAAPGVEQKLLADLATRDPEAARQFAIDRQGQAETQRKREGEMSQAAANIQRALANAPTPEARAAIEQRAFDLQKKGLLGRFEVSGPASRPEQVAGLGAQADAVLGSDAPKPTGDMVEFVSISGLQPNNPRFGPAFDAWKEQQNRSKATQINNSVGSVGLTQTTQTDQQKEVIKSRLRLQQLGNMREAIEAAGGYDALGSYRERGAAAYSEIARKAGAQTDEDAMARRASAIAAVGGFTNPIVSELSGANVPPSEWDRVVQSLPDPINDSGPVLKAKIDGWERNLKIIDEFGVDYLVNGITTGKIKLPENGARPGVQKTAPARNLGPEGNVPKLDPTAQPQRRDPGPQQANPHEGKQLPPVASDDRTRFRARAKELLGSGASPEQVAAQLVREGMPKGTANAWLIVMQNAPVVPQ